MDSLRLKSDECTSVLLGHILRRMYPKMIIYNREIKVKKIKLKVVFFKYFNSTLSFSPYLFLKITELALIYTVIEVEKQCNNHELQRMGRHPGLQSPQDHQTTGLPQGSCISFISYYKCFPGNLSIIPQIASVSFGTDASSCTKTKRFTDHIKM